MYLLAFESSCDDTSIALLQDEVLVCMKTHTQLEHIATAWVVPETAARLHANHVFELLDEVLKIWDITLKDVDVFAATSEPGLIPALLIGKTVAKTLSKVHDKPLIWVNHIEWHIFSVLLERKIEDIVFPAVVLSASGGHNDLFLWDSLFGIEKLWGTLDDSAGESMDKVGRSMGLPFPAGRDVDQLAQKYNPEIHTNIPRFPLVLPADWLNFSFSGIKSAAIREIELRKIQNMGIELPPPWEGGQEKRSELGGFYIPYRPDLTQKAQKKQGLTTPPTPPYQGGGNSPSTTTENSWTLTENDRIEIAYGYQNTVTEILTQRIMQAQKETQATTICLVGGVSANSLLRTKVEDFWRKIGVPVLLPKSLKYCGDNAAMIGIRAYWEYQRNKQ